MMETLYDREWYEDDTPIDLSKYDHWTKEQIDMEIARLEEEGRKERDRLRKERVLAIWSDGVMPGAAGNVL